ncbi:MAG TPA: hypothetical protein VH044_07895, partial [Polyangiaceae bacterium]|nr:hypothetical protein [Polyangiaceae bacterium]
MGGLARTASAGLAGLAIACVSTGTQAGFGAPRGMPPEGPYRLAIPAPAPAAIYAKLDRAACEAELTERGVAFKRVGSARGVLEPVRLVGPVHGVTYRGMAPPSQRATSVLEIVDCRLALALDDFAAQLAEHDVVEVVHFSIYRPPSAR